MPVLEDAALSQLDPSDPYARTAQTFARLSDAMAARLSAYGREEDLPKGTVLFERGERNVDFFFVLSGNIEIFDLDSRGACVVLTVHNVHEFTGELDLFSQRRILVSARTGEDSRVVRIPRSGFQRLIAAEPDIGEILMRAFILRRVGLVLHEQGGIAVIGPRHAAATLRIENFLTRNNCPHRVIDTDADPAAGGLVETFHLEAADLPVVLTFGERMLRNPSNAALADELGLMISAEDLELTYDLAVVGAGPAGLAVAVYAASEGLKTIVLESVAPGGQAGTSSKIENYLGFPTGVTGRALAGRAQVQALKFGAKLAISRAAAHLDCSRQPYRLRLDGGGTVTARSVVIASGARYRTLDVADYERFVGQGIHYAATAIEARLCKDETVLVIGGGNSAGQAAVFLSQQARHVHMLVRGPSLAASMSDYLIRRIDSSAHITLHPHCALEEVSGEGSLRQVRWVDRRTGASETHAIGNVFVMIGAEPNTDWLNGCLELDGNGFVKTGGACDAQAPLSPYATSRQGIFAVGDVRAGSVKRVASAVGEGSAVVQAIHYYLNPGTA